MSIDNRVVQDRRWYSRLLTLLACEYTFQEVTHQAVIVDLSLNGALLSSKYLPPNGSVVRLFLRSPQLKKPLALDGTVLRGGWGTSEHGELSRFAVQFKGFPPELIKVLNTLISEQEDNVPTAS